MLPVANMEVTKVLEITEIKDIQRVNLKKVEAYSGTVFNQISNIVLVPKRMGSAKNQVRKKEYFEPRRINVCI